MDNVLQFPKHVRVETRAADLIDAACDAVHLNSPSRICRALAELAARCEAVGDFDAEEWFAGLIGDRAMGK